MVLLGATDSAQANLAWVPWVLNVVFGVATVVRALRRERHDKSTTWQASLRNELTSNRNEVTALIMVSKSETLLALANDKAKILLGLKSVEGRLQPLEKGLAEVRTSVREVRAQGQALQREETKRFLAPTRDLASFAQLARDLLAPGAQGSKAPTSGQAGGGPQS
jgi:hypothetical protein